MLGWELDGKKRRAQIATALGAIKPKRLSAMLVSCESHGGFVYPTCTRKQLKWPTSRSLSPTGASNMTQALSFLSQATSTWRWRRHPYAQTETQSSKIATACSISECLLLKHSRHSCQFMPTFHCKATTRVSKTDRRLANLGQDFHRVPHNNKKSSATTTTTSGIRSTC